MNERTVETRMIWRDLQKIRTEVPLVHNITNYVVMNSTANALLAVGASPVMAHALEEMAEMVALAQALVINIGTLSSPWIEAMIKAGQEANRCGVPVVLDPVGSGATPFRTETAHKLLREIHPAIVRGNGSEIRSLRGSGSGTRGVDSQHAPEAALADARALSASFGCVVSMSGPVDLIVQNGTVARIENGHPLMARVTGMGCTASAITGAFAAVSGSPFQAAVEAMAVMGIAGEMAADRAAGPGSFQALFLDALHCLAETDIARRLRMDGRMEDREGTA